MKSIPFSNSELEPQGFFYTVKSGKAPIYHTPVTPKENFKTALRGEKPLWVPMFSDCRKFITNIIVLNFNI